MKKRDEEKNKPKEPKRKPGRYFDKEKKRDYEDFGRED